MQLKFAADIYVSMTSLWNREQHVQGVSWSLVMQFVFGIIMSTHSALELRCLHSCYNIAALHSCEIPWFVALPFCFSLCFLTANTPVQKAVEYFYNFSHFITTFEVSSVFKETINHQSRGPEDHWEVPGATCIPLGTGTCAQLKLRRELAKN